MIGRIHISLAALRHNAQALRGLVGPDSAAFVVKSNAYGHGLVDVARAIEPFATRICVYGIDEALALRAAGIAAPVLVLGPVPPDALHDAVAGEIELALWDGGNYVRDLAAVAQARGITAAVHIKVNTGLNRLGIEPGALASALDSYARQRGLAVTGIFSHLAAAEELDSPFTMQQLAVFEGALADAQAVLDANALAPVRHIAASAAAMIWPQTRLDMSRFGIALYGLWPSQATREAMNAHALDLHPVLSYRSELVVVRELQAGEAVGYGTTFHAPRAMRLGIVPCGYGDGVPRLLSNRGAFVVDGVRCPIVGRIAMNMTSIDITKAKNAHVGSTVTLIGDDGDASVTADDWAEWSETINYEIVTRLPAEIPRAYA